MAVSYRNAAGQAVYVGPRAIYEAAAALIAKAKHEIVIQTFAFDASSDPARRVFIALKQRALEHAAKTPKAPPIVTRFLIDTMPTGMNGNASTESLMRGLAEKIEAMGFAPADMRFELVAFEHSYLGSSHSKLIGIDGHTFLVTGSNFGPDNGFEDGEHDAGFLVEGDVAHALEATHAALRALPGARTYACGSRTLLPGTGAGPDADECSSPPAPLTPSPPEARPDDASCSPMAVFAKPPDDGFFASDSVYALDDALVGAFDHAKGEIDLASPNLNAADVKDAILRAVQRGETVKLILSKNYEDRSEWVPGQGGELDQRRRAVRCALERGPLPEGALRAPPDPLVQQGRQGADRRELGAREPREALCLP